MRIVLTGGGTGGHIFPLVAVARELVAVAAARQEALRLVFLGPAREAKQALDAEGVVVRGIAAGKLRRYLSPYYLVDIPKIAFGMVQSCIYLWWYMPDAVFSKGGYGSFTTVLVAWLFRIPVYLHESDSVAGLSNRLLARFSRRIFVSFPGEYPEFSRDRI
ncbi:MAG: glycosyltransferase, partial [Candidatus Spechtbacterales bacterium]